MKISYHKWVRHGSTIRAYGGSLKEYTHNCPIDDFLIISDIIKKVIIREGMVSKIDVFKIMEGKTLSKNRIFKKKSHEYKVKIIFDILLSEHLIEKKGIKKNNTSGKGRRPYGYKLKVSTEDYDMWITENILN